MCDINITMMIRAVLLSVTYKLAASPSPRNFMEMQILISNFKPRYEAWSLKVCVLTSPPVDSCDMLREQKH